MRWWKFRRVVKGVSKYGIQAVTERGQQPEPSVWFFLTCSFVFGIVRMTYSSGTNQPRWGSYSIWSDCTCRFIQESFEKCVLGSVVHDRVVFSIAGRSRTRRNVKHLLAKQFHFTKFKPNSETFTSPFYNFFYTKNLINNKEAFKYFFIKLNNFQMCLYIFFLGFEV